jgi:AcrR family transcriptional regulator
MMSPFLGFDYETLRVAFSFRLGCGLVISDTGPRRVTGRPRSPQIDARLIDATLALLREAGPEAVSVQAVATRSGIAKTTIYRRYRNRDAMLRAAIESAVTPPSEPPSADVHDRVRWALSQVREILGEVLGPGGVAALLEEREPGFVGLVREVLDPYNDALVTLINADVAAGRLRPDLDADAVVSLLMGSYLGELLRRGVVEDAWLSRCAELIWHAIT